MKPPYPWKEEPNVGTADAYGYRCRLRRNTELGTWCGYVVIPADHPWYGCSIGELTDVRVHGGITYSGGDLFDGTEWCVGFDCGHAFDMVPMLVEHAAERGEPMALPDGIYRDYDYAMGEAVTIAEQAMQAVAGDSGDPLDRSDEELTRAVKRLRGDAPEPEPPSTPLEFQRYPEESDAQFKRRIIEANARVAAGMAPRRRHREPIRPHSPGASEAIIDDPERKDPW